MYNYILFYVYNYMCVCLSARFCVRILPNLKLQHVLLHLFIEMYAGGWRISDVIYHVVMKMWDSRGWIVNTGNMWYYISEAEDTIPFFFRNTISTLYQMRIYDPLTPWMNFSGQYTYSPLRVWWGDLYHLSQGYFSIIKSSGIRNRLSNFLTR